MYRWSRRCRWSVLATTSVVAVVALLSSCVPASGPPPIAGTPPPGSAATDSALAAFTVLPPGNGGIDGPTNNDVDDQRLLYDGLDDPVAAGTLTDADLTTYYKPARLGSAAAPGDRIEDFSSRGREVRVRWDRWSVPHVQGQRATDVAYGAGYASAEARFAIMEVLRRLGRSGLLEVAGGIEDVAGQLAHIGDFPHVAYSDAELNAQIDRAVAAAPTASEGRQILAAMDAYVAGVNAWMTQAVHWPPLLASLGVAAPAPFTRADIVASGIAVNDIFGYAGGDEVGNAEALRTLADRFGPTIGRAVFDDLRDADDPAATTTAPGRFPYPLFASSGTSAATDVSIEDPAAVALPDRDATAMVAGSSDHAPPHASNWVLLDAGHSATRHPVFVGGPQSSYFAPQLLFEMELQGGGYRASGITMPGLGPWVVIGHSTDYAWSATSGDSDQVDERIERLCEPDGAAPSTSSRSYLFNGACLAMTKGDASDPQALWRTVHGPVVGTTTVGGEPVAIAKQRSSRGFEAEASVSFWRLSRGEVTTAAEFAPTMQYVPMSFNWAYVNSSDIAYFHSGRYPVRAAGTSGDLPSWGTGQWEWRGYLDWTQQPQVIDPPQGFLASWNNKPAPGWRTADDDWGTGGVQRVDLLAERMRALDNATVADVVSAHQDAATADLRGSAIVPSMLAVLATGPAPSARLDDLRSRLGTYAASGAHRRDRDHDYFYDDAMTPVVDNLFGPLVHAVFDDVLGSAYMSDGGPRRPGSLDNPPVSTGSAFNTPTWYSLVQRELQRAAGTVNRPVGVPPMCGAGDLAVCRARLWSALERAAYLTQDQQLFKQADVDTWRKWTVPERITFLPYVVDANSMRWVNRPTFEQVMSFG